MCTSFAAILRNVLAKRYTNEWSIATKSQREGKIVRVLHAAHNPSFAGDVDVAWGINVIIIHGFLREVCEGTVYQYRGHSAKPQQ
jgi:hypothetical protein